MLQQCPAWGVPPEGLEWGLGGPVAAASNFGYGALLGKAQARLQAPEAILDMVGQVVSDT